MKTHLFAPTRAILQRPRPRQPQFIHRHFSFFCAAWILLMLLPAVVEAQFTFRTNAGAITITGYSGTNGNAVIPAYTNGLPVRSIAPGAFVSCYVLTNVTIPGTVTNIGDWAFEDCFALLSVNIPGSVACIQTGTFDQCNSLIDLTISNGVTSIADQAFLVCSSLTNVTIPASVTNIGDYAFENCYDLTNITLPDGLRSIGKFAFGFSSLTSIAIPASVTSLGESAFYGTSLTTVAIPGSVTTLQNQTFSRCYSLETATISNGVSGIGTYAFYQCTSLAHVTIPAGVTNIGDSAFERCPRLAHITIPASVTNIGNSAFEMCSNLTALYFQGNAPGVGSYAFFYDWYTIAYYLPGTTGWDAFSASTGVPAMLWTPQALPAITSPAPGSALGSSSATFQWSSGTGVTNYFLYVGTSFGARDLYSQSQGVNLSATVNGLPVDGSPLYVRLWWITAAGRWTYDDYTYTAVSGIGAAPSLGTRLQGGSIILFWPSNASGFTLECATNLPAGSWTPATPSPVIVNGQYAVTNTMSDSRKFFRLMK